METNQELIQELDNLKKITRLKFIPENQINPKFIEINHIKAVKVKIKNYKCTHYCSCLNKAAVGFEKEYEFDCSFCCYRNEINEKYLIMNFD